MPAKRQRMVAAVLLLWLGAGFAAAQAQEAVSTAQQSAGQTPNREETAGKQAMDGRTNLDLSAPAKTGRSFRPFLGEFLSDQKELWTSPSKLRFSDTDWLVPVAGVTAALFASDAQFSRHLSNDPQTLRHYSSLSNAGLVGLAGTAGTMWLWSHRNHNSHWQETGYLATKAAFNSFVLSESLKYSLGRSRPYEGAGGGGFFQGGTSFPSEHSAAAWSIASVVAHEYPGPLTKVLVYGAAALVSFSRVRAKDHFPTDVVVGALIGELSGYQAYSRYHDPELGGDAWVSWGE